MLKKVEDQRWITTFHNGIKVCMLRENETGGATILLKVAAGAAYPMHSHPGGEEAYVLSGRAVIGGATLEAGDYLWTPPNGVHELRAEEETLLFINAPSGIEMVSDCGSSCACKEPAPSIVEIRGLE
jgi:quercetin dioxygenase-like cupin family protein